MEFEQLGPCYTMDYIPGYLILQQASSCSPLMDIEAPESPAIQDVNKFIDDLKNVLQVNDTNFHTLKLSLLSVVEDTT